MVFLEYLPNGSFFHRLDIRSKLVWFLCINFLAFIFWHPLFVGALFLSTILVGIAIGMPFKKFLSLMKMLTIPLCFIIGYEALAYPGKTVVFIIGNIGFVKLEGLIIGLTFFFRIMVMVFSSSILTLTTPIFDFLSLLTKYKLPYELAFIIVTGIRFIPVLEREAMMTFDAQKARGAELEASKGFMQTLRAYIPIMLPMLIGAVRRSETLAMAMVARGFGSTKKLIPLHEIKVSRIDYIFSFFIVLILILGIYAWYLGYGKIVFWE
ncbi:MAG: energy-coupling factor transporter transmembrane component T [Candidatus Bathyarchaeia archaeon]